MDKERALYLFSLHTNKIRASSDIMNEINDVNVWDQNLKIKQILYHVIHNIQKIPKCKNTPCCNYVKWDNINLKYSETCSKKCANKFFYNSKKTKIQQTNLKKYGGIAPACCIEIKEKAKQTCVDKFGNDYIEKISELSKQGSMKKYNVDNPTKNKSISDKIKVAWDAKNDNEKKEIQFKRMQTSIEKYGRTNPNQIQLSQNAFEILNDKKLLTQLHDIEKLNVSEIANKLNVSITTVYNSFLNLNIENKRWIKHNLESTGQTEVFNFLKSLDESINIQTNVRNIIYPKEIDIYLPDYNLAIEYNGLYWHSEASGKDKKYHLEKTKLCEEKGIRLIHIFEDEWFNMKQQCKDTLKHFLGKSEKGDYARHCTIREISWQQAKQFLNEYHLLGAGASGNYRIGAFNKQNDLIGVMVFGKQNNENSNGEVELRRFVTNKKNNPGVGSKMFKYAINQKHYTTVIAFVDRRWFTGLVKDHIGFEKVDETPPALWWTDGYKRLNRRYFSKNKMQKITNNVNDSKHNIIRSLGFYQIWDSGKLKLKWTQN